MTKHNLTLRDVERLTGVSKATLCRILNGYVGPTLEYQINRIVAGLCEHDYQITREELLEGLDPRADFEWTIRQASPEQRLDYVAMTLQERVRLTLDFLRTRYPAKCRAHLLASVSRLETQALEGLLSNWDNRQPDYSLAKAIATGINELTEITMAWFTTGWLDEEDPTEVIVREYAGLVENAVTTTLTVRNALRVLRSSLLQPRVTDGHGMDRPRGRTTSG